MTTLGTEGNLIEDPLNVSKSDSKKDVLTYFKQTNSTSKRGIVIVIVLTVLIVVVLGITIPLVVSKKKGKLDSSEVVDGAGEDISSLSCD